MGFHNETAIVVEASRNLTRQIMAPLLKPQIEIFLKAGFAFFLDDIPGAGGSTGEIKSVYQDRAGEIAALKNASRIRSRDFPAFPGRRGRPDRAKPRPERGLKSLFLS